MSSITDMISNVRFNLQNEDTTLGRLQELETNINCARKAIFQKIDELRREDEKHKEELARLSVSMSVCIKRKTLLEKFISDFEELQSGLHEPQKIESTQVHPAELVSEDLGNALQQDFGDSFEKQAILALQEHSVQEDSKFIHSQRQSSRKRRVDGNVKEELSETQHPNPNEEETKDEKKDEQKDEPEEDKVKKNSKKRKVRPSPLTYSTGKALFEQRQLAVPDDAPIDAVPKLKRLYISRWIDFACGSVQVSPINFYMNCNQRASMSADKSKRAYLALKSKYFGGNEFGPKQNYVIGKYPVHLILADKEDVRATHVYWWENTFQKDTSSTDIIMALTRVYGGTTDGSPGDPRVFIEKLRRFDTTESATAALDEYAAEMKTPFVYREIEAAEYAYHTVVNTPYSVLWMRSDITDLSCFENNPFEMNPT